MLFVLLKLRFSIFFKLSFGFKKWVAELKCKQDFRKFISIFYEGHQAEFIQFDILLLDAFLMSYAQMCRKENEGGGGGVGLKPTPFN